MKIVYIVNGHMFQIRGVTLWKKKKTKLIAQDTAHNTQNNSKSKTKPRMRRNSHYNKKRVNRTKPFTAQIGVSHFHLDNYFGIY